MQELIAFKYLTLVVFEDHSILALEFSAYLENPLDPRPTTLDP